MDREVVVQRVAGLLPRADSGCVFSHGRGSGVVGGLRESYTGNARAVYEWCVDEGLDAVWLHASSGLDRAKGRAHSFRSVRGALACLRARVSMGGSNNGAPFAFLSPETWAIQGWHGTPLKAIGRAGAGEVDERDARILERADFVISPGEEFSRRFAQCYHVSPQQFWTLGNPRNDVLVRADAAATQQRQEQLRAALHPLSFDRVLLYAPTWRDWHSEPTFLPVPDRDIERMNSFLRDRNEVLVLRVHHREAQAALSLTAAAERIIVSDAVGVPWDVADWCIAADVLVTDYSSIYYDYLLLDRPIVHLVPDLDEYAERRGFLVDPVDDAGGPMPRTQSALLACLEDAVERPGDGAALRERLNTLHNPLEDGQSSARVGRALMSLFTRPRSAR